MKYRGFAEVFKALDKTTNTYVALKVLRRAHDNDSIEQGITAHKQCTSPFIVRYLSSYCSDKDSFVRFRSGCLRIDCDGVL